jgi:hypothetical protein
MSGLNAATDPDGRAVGFVEVDGSPYELARYWGDRGLWPIDPDWVEALHELAVVARLGDWLWRWQPLHMHRAVKAGACGAEVAAAAGCGAEAVAARWRRWVRGQRHLYELSQPRASGRRPGVSLLEAARVAAVLEADIPPLLRVER